MTFAPLSEREVRQILLRALGPNGAVRISDHAWERMDQRNLDEQFVRRALRRGIADGEGFENGSWRYRRRCGTTIIVVALDPPSAIVVVTAFDERSRT